MTTVLDTAIAPAIRRDIETRLDLIEADHDVRILMAIESGSRAWGFPSPDSDYDVRFVYVRPRDWYLSLAPGRDVIETPIEDEIDLNGWDVRKALGLLLKSNAVVNEWIQSPIRYRPDDPIVAKIAALADRVLDARALAHHYSRLGRDAADRWLDGIDDVPVKRYFYALRPALAIRVLRLHQGVRPPMNLQELVAMAELPGTMVSQIETLVAAKARTNERDNGARVPALDRLIRDEIGRASDLPKPDPDARWRDEADRLFLELVNT
jgi:predicted nucleotidyltransferase